jgi:hypothetical protein
MGFLILPKIFHFYSRKILEGSQGKTLYQKQKTGRFVGCLWSCLSQTAVL